MKALPVINRPVAHLSLLFAALLFISTYCAAQDSLPPVLHSISLTPDTVQAGDSVVVTIEMTDDVSGIAGNGIPSGPFLNGSYILVRPVAPPIVNMGTDSFTHIAGNFYRAAIAIPSNAKNGPHHIYSVGLYDIAGNVAYYYHTADFTVNFTVVNPVVDTIPPRLLSLTLSNDTIAVPTPFEIQIEVIDTQSGFNNIFSWAYISSPSRVQNKSYSNWQSVNGFPDKRRSSQYFNKWMEGGLWRVDSIRVRDNALNERTYYNGTDFAGDFFVIDSIPDITRPELLSSSVSPQQVHRGDSITVLIELRDTISGLDTSSTSAVITTNTGQQVFTINAWKPLGGDFFMGRGKLSEYATNGTWWMQSVTARDVANTTYYQLSSMATFTVINDSIDLVSGTILTSTGMPLANSRVFLIKQDPVDSNIYAMRRTFTDAVGNYQFNAERRDSFFYIKAIPDTAYHNELPTYCYSTTSFAQAQQFRLTGGTTTVATFRTVSGTNPGGMGFISGWVSQGAGKREGTTPMAGLELVLATTQGDMLQFTITDNDGYFEFRNIPDGEYNVYPLQDTVDIDLSPVLTINGNTSYTDIEFVYEETYLSAELPQAEQQFAPVGAVWHYGRKQVSGTEKDYYRFESVKDTVMNGKDCRIIERQNGLSCSYSPARICVYEEDSAVYFYDTLHGFQVLYDLKTKQDSSWTTACVTVLGADTVTVRVDTAYLVDYNGHDLKTLFVTYLKHGGVWGTSMIVERIGNVSYLFSMSLAEVACDGDLTDGLRCYEDTLLGLYQTSLAPSCEYKNVGIDDLSHTYLTIYPNPASGKIEITSPPQHITAIELLDMSGRIAATYRDVQTISVAGVGEGMYFLRITDSEKNYYFGKVVVN